MIKVRVPATTANFGAGFDCLGMAISLYNYVYMDWSDRLLIKSLDGTRIPTNNLNLVYKSAEYLFKLSGKKDFKSLKILQKNNVPKARGLGSSSCCIVAGLFGANALLGSVFKKKELLNIATKLEGHPDNVAPCMFGGFVVSSVENEKVFYVRNNVSYNLKFVFFIPNFKLSTEKSRKILKDKIDLKDAVYNISRSSLLVSSILKGKFSNLEVSTKDKLHQDYRLKYIENGKEIFDISYKLGAYGVFLSGAGPSIVAIYDRSNISFEKEASLKLKEKGIVNFSISKLDVDKGGVVAQIT